jgi:predicted nucleotidyltransferase
MATESGSVLREARRNARLSQTDVARRSGIAQSVISAYESGRREPASRRLLGSWRPRATGSSSTSCLRRAGPSAFRTLPWDVGSDADRRSGVTDEGARPLGAHHPEVVGQGVGHSRTIIETASRRGAQNVRVFGSVARGGDTESSDVDLLVDLDDGVGLVALVGLKRELTELLGVDVDVVPADSLKSRLRDEVLAESVPL